MTGVCGRPSPCPSCPYRRDVPSGIWAADQYEKLPAYDGETWAQPRAVFFCHQGDGQVCAGWLGFGDPDQLLAVRLGIRRGELDPSCATYSTDVPLFTSGAEAAEHGVRDIDAPGPDATAAIAKIVRVRDARGVPVRWSR